MEWIKVPTKAVLYSEFTKAETFTLIRYQALYCELESEPSETQMKHIFSKKEREFIRSNIEVTQELIQSTLEVTKKHRNRSKLSYKRKQGVTESSASSKSAQCVKRQDKTRQDNIKDTNVSKKKAPKNEKVWRFNPEADTDEKWRDVAFNHGLTEEHASDEFSAFQEHFTIGKGKNVKRANWILSWKSWVRKTTPTNNPRNSGRAPKTDKLTQACIEVLNERGDR